MNAFIHIAAAVAAMLILGALIAATLEYFFRDDDAGDY